MADDDGLRFAERLLSLIDSARTSATYKLATLMALIEVVAETADPTTGTATVVSARRVARRVVELYWPQSAVYGSDASSQPTALRQSAQNDIPAKLHAWRRQHRIGHRASLDAARAADPAGWDALERDLIATVLRMPIPKLQRFGDGRTAVEDRFIYDFAWRDEEAKGRVMQVDFDDRLHLGPKVGEYLVRLAPLLRPAIEAKWAALVAKQNTHLLDHHQLGEFLFGADRIDLSPVRTALVDSQSGYCFYCDGVMRAVVEVDHFVPWSRHPDNTLDNLVAAHRSCNAAKSASIAGHRHLDRWLQRLKSPALDHIADATGWPRRWPRTLGSVSATYLWLPSGSRLWLHGNEFEPIDLDHVRQQLTAAA